MTEVPPDQAQRVERSQHADLVCADALHAIAGVLDRDADDLPLHDRRARQALNLAEELYAELPRHTSQAGLMRRANAIDRFVREQALALFLCAPDALYAVNRHVRFKPYATTFELAETEVGDGHWSVR